MPDTSPHAKAPPPQQPVRAPAPPDPEGAPPKPAEAARPPALPLAEARARLARGAYAYLRPFAEPLIAQLEDSGPGARGDELRARLAAMFAVSHSETGFGLTDVKAASNRYHAELGARVVAELDKLPVKDAPGTLAAAQSEALRLAEEVDPLLEDGVALTVVVDRAAAARDELAIGLTIAPNNWFTRMVGSIARGAYDMGVDAYYGAVRRRGSHNATAADTRGRTEAQADAAGIQQESAARFAATVPTALGPGWAVAQANNAWRLTPPQNGAPFTVRVLACPLGDRMVRPMVNATKHAHVIELSERMTALDVPRALAQALGEISAHERRMANRALPVELDVLGRGDLADARGAFTARDEGAIAQLRVLLDNPEAHNPNGTYKRRELYVLVEDLGLRNGGANQAARRQRIQAALSGPQNLALQPYLTGDDDPTAQGVSQGAHAFARLRARDQIDASKQVENKRGARDGELHQVPLADRRVARVDPAPLARQAAQARAQKSAAMVVKYRGLALAAQLQNQLHEVHNPQIGGGAALAAIQPGQLLVDARGRWQRDASRDLAQTAAQLAGLRDAGIGDPYDFVAHPDDRVPLEAVTYWEDSIAMQADVIDGAGTIGIDGQGRMVLTIAPTAGGNPIVLQVGGTPVVATGFPREQRPIGRVMMHKALEDLTGALAAMGGTAGATAFAQRIAGIDSGDDAAVDAAFAPVLLQPALLLALQQHANPDVVAATRALEALHTWVAERTNTPQRVLTGDEANSLDTLNPMAATHWVIAGTGGTGISAAEIILQRNPRSYVTMVGGNLTAGLADNDQFRSVWRTYGPAGTGRFEVVTNQTIGSLGIGQAPDGNRVFEAGARITGQQTLTAGQVPGNVAVQSTWLVAADVTLLPAVTQILQGHPGSRVTIHGAAIPDGFAGNQALTTLLDTYGPTSGDRRLQVVTGYYAANTQAAHGGGFELLQPVGGGGYIAALGRTGQVSVIDALVRAARARNPADVTGALRFDGDGHYLGYRVTITNNGANPKHIDVTGAASRFLPPNVFTAQQQAVVTQQLRAASDADAPPESGNFDGGFVSSATQAARYGRQRREESEQRVAQNYRLTGGHAQLVLPQGQQNTWHDLVADFLAAELPAPRERLKVAMLGGGATGDPLFKVTVGSAELGVFKVFRDQAQAQNELDQLAYLAGLNGGQALDHARMVGRRAGLQPATINGQGGKHGILMETGPGRSVDSLVANLPPPQSPVRQAAVVRVRDASVLVGRALAEIHFRSMNGMQTRAQKTGAGSDGQGIWNKVTRLVNQVNIPPPLQAAVALAHGDFAGIQQALQPVLHTYVQNPVPRTAYHGDANAGNFMIDGGNVTVIDVGYARWSHGAIGATATGANDIAKFLNSLETLHPQQANRLVANELALISNAFMAAYLQTFNGYQPNAAALTQNHLDAAITMYRIEGEIAAMYGQSFTVPQSVARMRAHLGI